MSLRSRKCSIHRLFIHLSGGRIETHFHIFGALAFIAFYRDWMLLLPATTVIAADHLLRGYLWPQSVFGTPLIEFARPFEHAGWVLFEDAFLIFSCISSVRDMKRVALSQATLEHRNALVEQIVEERTVALREQTAALSGSADMLRRTGAMARVGGWELDLASENVTWTDELYAIHEIERGTPIRFSDVLEFYPPEAREQIASVMRSARAGNTWDAVMPFVTPSGRRLWVRVRGEPIWHNGEVVKLRGALQDVTDSENASLAVHQRAEEMSRLRDAADAASRAKSEFLANMSHEIRTPLTAILGFADLLQEEESSEEHSRRGKLVDTIQSAGRHLLTVINDILDLSRIEAGKLTVEAIETPLTEILADVGDLLRPRAIGKGLRLAARLESPLPDVIISDPTRLRQILMNIVGNAVKFTEVGSVTLTARAENSLQGGEASRDLVIDVTDTGPGLSAAQSAKLFGAFEQADASTTRKYGGTGLGLSICLRLALLMGGRVSLLRSELGQGSCFRVRLPLLAAPNAQLVEELNHRARQTVEVSAPPIHLSGRILLAEDGPDNQRLIAFHLRKAGAEVVIADNGRIALEMLEQAEQRFDLLVSDMQMPEMDGYTLAHTLRSRGSRLPIVALTAHAMAEDRQRCVDAGCDDYATKPIDKVALLKTCAAWMHRQSDCRLVQAAVG